MIKNNILSAARRSSQGQRRLRAPSWTVLWAGAFAVSALAGAGCVDDDNEPTDSLRPRVSTTLGTVVGRRSPPEDVDGVRVFRGIPYVAAPTDAARFRGPRPHLGWTTARDAASFGAICPQLPFGQSQLVGEEDCLTLNIWSPDAAEALPVMVWIHGGGFTAGAGSEPAFDGELLAREQKVVVVTFNYRLGLLGFAASEELADEADVPYGNMGILDQIAALEWVRDNIAAFGGDPSAVTLFGESAGGGSIAALLGAQRADGLYRAAIIQSGGGGFGLRARDHPDDELNPETIMAGVLENLECTDIAVTCLREASTETLVRALPQIDGTTVSSLSAAGPVVDGSLISKQPYDRIRDGEAPRVPLIMGALSDELGFLRLIGGPVDYETLLQQSFGELAPVVAEAYPLADFDSARGALAAVLGDITFVCPVRELAEVAPNPTYVYLFDHALSGPQAILGAFHALDLPYTFGTLSELPFSATATTADEVVSQFMRDAWGRFARDTEVMSAWSAWDDEQALLRITESPSLLVQDGARCDALREAGIVDPNSGRTM